MATQVLRPRPAQLEPACGALECGSKLPLSAPASLLAGISAGGRILRQQAGSNQSGSKLPHSKAQGDSLDGFFRGWRIFAAADFSCMRPQLLARGVHAVRSIARTDLWPKW